MPQATAELSRKMKDRFGCGVNEAGPWDFLLQNGWQCNRGVWMKTPMPCLDDVPQDEYDCLLFLIQEWDHDIATLTPTAANNGE